VTSAGRTSTPSIGIELTRHEVAVTDDMTYDAAEEGPLPTRRCSRDGHRWPFDARRVDELPRTPRGAARPQPRRSISAASRFEVANILGWTRHQVFFADLDRVQTGHGASTRQWRIGRDAVERGLLTCTVVRRRRHPPRPPRLTELRGGRRRRPRGGRWRSAYSWRPGLDHETRTKH